jgi:hypothetical protein
MGPKKWEMVEAIDSAMVWLPIDERRLLAAYFVSIGRLGADEAFQLDTLGRALSFTWRVTLMLPYGEEPARPIDDQKALKEATVKYIRESKRVEAANRTLAARGLIALSPAQPVPSVVVLNLTLAGYDLGRRYASWWDWSGLLFREYKDHWLWLLAACAGGGVVAKFLALIFTHKGK